MAGMISDQKCVLPEMKNPCDGPGDSESRNGAVYPKPRMLKITQIVSPDGHQ